MNDSKLELQIKLMQREAAKHLQSSGLLSSAVAGSSHSAYLLELLAFEILMKATVLIHGGALKRSHNYPQIFNLLPEPVQARVKETARLTRVTADYSHLDSVLRTLHSNFVSLRYPYEKYSGFSETEYVERGEQWIANGSQLSKADFIYYSPELNGLTHGLHLEVCSWLGIDPA